MHASGALGATETVAETVDRTHLVHLARAGALLVVGMKFAEWRRSGTYGYSFERGGSQLSIGAYNVLGRALCV